jgi:hypothetical protein
MKISISLNVILLIALLALGYFYHRDTSSLEEKLASAQRVSVPVSNKKEIAELVFGYRKPTFQEEAMFEDQYRAASECANPENNSVWVRCVESRKKALIHWLKKRDGH